MTGNFENAFDPNDQTLADTMLYSIPLRGVVPFPGMVIRASLGSQIRLDDLDETAQEGNIVFLTVQKNAGNDSMPIEFFEIGVVAKILRSENTENGEKTILFEGMYRAKCESVAVLNNRLYCRVNACPVYEEDEDTGRKLLERLFKLLLDYTRFTSQDALELVMRLKELQSAGEAADFIAANYLHSHTERYALLEELQPLARALLCCTVLEKQIAVCELQGTIQAKVKYRLHRHQREAFLREEMRTIREELGGEEEAQQNGASDEESYESKIKAASLPESVAKKLLSENAKLEKMPFGSAEASVIQTYLDTCLELPWNVYREDRLDLSEAQSILEEDHEGILKVKERILEFLAVKKLNPDSKGQILCFVGPPGVGKTSVAKSISRATNRDFVRISLGGVRDEAEIRGHRKTYIGAMPGRIIQAIKQAGSSNPVILLDELDKMTQDSHGDPASALLEVLDAEQNHTFRDHFVEMPYDLSKVLFIATANTLDTVPPALLDRLEVIEMNSYTDREKLQIAQKYLIPKELANNGLQKAQCQFTEEALQLLITGYTHENGVRNLQRAIASVCRKTARRIVTGEVKHVRVTANAVKKALGPVKYLSDKISEKDEIGIVNGLAWTSLGGELLRVEVSSVQGDGKLELTGNLGDVMKESAKAAVSYIRKHSKELGIDPEFYTKRDVHIHVPEGAVPKDGPSAGVTLCTALVSELTGKTVKRNVAMTGEITLTGRVLPIGGLREKTMAAYKFGCDTVIIPFGNSGDLEELDGEVRAHLKMIPVKTVSEVLRFAVN